MLKVTSSGWISANLNQSPVEYHGRERGKKRELDFKVTGYFSLDSLFSRNKQLFLVCRSPEGGGSRWSAAGQEITPPRDDAGSCPCVSANICWAEVCLNLHQLLRLRSVADVALCHPHHEGTTRGKIEFTPGDQ